MSVDWFDESIPDGGASSRLGRLLDVAYNIEYGAESGEQSSLYLLYLLGYSGQGQFRVFGPSNEKYHVRGGNDLVATRLRDALQGQLTMGSELVAVKKTAAGAYTLTFKQGSKTVTVRGQARPRVAFLDHPALGERLAGRILGAQGADDQRDRHGHELEVARSVLAQVLERARVER